MGFLVFSSCWVFVCFGGIVHFGGVVLVLLGGVFVLRFCFVCLDCVFFIICVVRLGVIFCSLSSSR